MKPFSTLLLQVFVLYLGHYYTTLNYIHYNPVKHGWSESAYDWSCSAEREGQKIVVEIKSFVGDRP